MIDPKPFEDKTGQGWRKQLHGKPAAEPEPEPYRGILAGYQPAQVKAIPPNTLTLNEYARAAASTAAPTAPIDDTPEGSLTLALLGLALAGESGEFADRIKKVLFQGHTLDRAKLLEELGDILWYIARASDLLGSSLGQVAADNIAKLAARYPHGFNPVKSINREV